MEKIMNNENCWLSHSDIRSGHVGVQNNRKQSLGNLILLLGKNIYLHEKHCKILLLIIVNQGMNYPRQPLELDLRQL